MIRDASGSSPCLQRPRGRSSHLVPDDPSRVASLRLAIRAACRYVSNDFLAQRFERNVIAADPPEVCGIGLSRTVEVDTSWPAGNEEQPWPALNHRVLQTLEQCAAGKRCNGGEPRQNDEPEVRELPVPACLDNESLCGIQPNGLDRA